jgi:hypothetical protein
MAWTQIMGNLLIKTTVFVAAECLLNLAGLDTLADYYEFLTGGDQIEVIRPVASSQIELALPLGQASSQAHHRLFSSTALSLI